MDWLLFGPDQDYFIAPTRPRTGRRSWGTIVILNCTPRPKQKPPKIFWQGVCVKVHSYHLVKLIIRLKGDPLLNLGYFRVFTQDVAKSTLQYIGFRNSWQPLDYLRKIILIKFINFLSTLYRQVIYHLTLEWYESGWWV